MLLPFAHLTQDDAAAGDFATALLPLAAMETHGPHLPLATDALIAEGIAGAAMRLDRGDASHLLLPTLWLGASAEHADRPGTLSREPELLGADIFSVGEAVARMGVSRLVLLVAHGGDVAAAAIAALRLRTARGMLVAHPHWLDFGLPPGLEAPAAVASDWHGGWIETSVMLHLHPDLVRSERISPHPPATDLPAMLAPHGAVPWAWSTRDLASGGAIGRPDLASADIGRRLVDHAALRLVALLDELAACEWPRSGR